MIFLFVYKEKYVKHYVAFGKRKEYLKDCFDSIKEQDYKDIETVLVLDKANINPEENIEEMISEFSQSINLKVYETGDNSGSKCRQKF